MTQAKVAQHDVRGPPAQNNFYRLRTQTRLTPYNPVMVIRRNLVVSFVKIGGEFSRETRAAFVAFLKAEVALSKNLFAETHGMIA
jgi:hypothetical protein